MGTPQQLWDPDTLEAGVLRYRLFTTVPTGLLFELSFSKGGVDDVWNQGEREEEQRGQV